MVAPSSSPNQSLTNSSLTNSNMKQKYFISNFCWSRFDSNKIIYATNMSIFNLKTFCLSDTIVFVCFYLGFHLWFVPINFNISITYRHGRLTPIYAGHRVLVE